MPNIHDQNFNKNVIEVYTEEPGFTGYKGLEWNKLDNIEDILTQGVVISGSLADSAYISGIKINTDSIDSKLFVTGDPFPAGIQGNIVFQADLTQQFDAVTTFPEQSTGISNFTVSGSNGLILAQNSNRRELYVQNLDTGTLYVKYGLNAASNSFNFILAANSSTNAGDGGSLNDQSYAGNVSVSGSPTVRYISWERTNIYKTPLVN
jgi:hypothetical protein